jgi:hypothetical protein
MGTVAASQLAVWSSLSASATIIIRKRWQETSPAPECPRKVRRQQARILCPSAVVLGVQSRNIAKQLSNRHVSRLNSMCVDVKPLQLLRTFSIAHQWKRTFNISLLGGSSRADERQREQSRSPGRTTERRSTAAILPAGCMDKERKYHHSMDVEMLKGYCLLTLKGI